MHPPLNESVLQQHASGLRAVARGLLSDEHAAEDVLQETWVAAIERPPASDSRLSGWLAGVVRRLALKRLRSEGRRRRREEGASRSEALAPVDENLEQREVLRGVIDAVLALPEPYQSVVFMRYYQDLPPREIAARLDAPVATVKSQLHRALEMLRRRLDAEAGGERRQWALALAAATGWQTPATPPAPSEPTASGNPFGEWAMEWKLLAGGMAVFVTGVSASYLSSEDEGGAIATARHGASVEAPGEGGPAAASMAAPGELARELQEGRKPVVGVGGKGTVPADRAAAGHREFFLSGVVLDEFDLPLHGAHVFVGPKGQPLNDLGETDAHGRFWIRWEGHGESMDVVVSVGERGYAAFGMRELSVRADEEHEACFVLNRPSVSSAAAEVKLKPVGADSKFAKATVLRKIELEQAAAVYPPGPRFAPTIDPDGLSWFAWPTVDKLERKQSDAQVFGRIERIKLVKEADFGRARELEASEFTIVEFAPGEGDLAFEPVPTEPVRLGGVVTDEQGRPVPKALVAVRENPEHGWSRFFTNEEGAFAFEVAGTSQVDIRAGGGDRGRDSTSLDLSEAGGRAVAWNANLERGLELLGTLKGTDGEPLAGWLVEFAGSGEEPVRDTAITDAAGRFSIANLPDVAGSLHARSPASDVFAHRVATDVRPGGESSWTLDVEPTGSVAIAVRDDAGEALPVAEVRLWQASTGRGQWARWSAEREAHALSGVVPGRYRVVVGSVGTGFVDMGDVHVAPGEALDLGSVTLSGGGRLDWSFTGEVEPAPVGWRLFRTGEDLDTWVAGGRLGEVFEDQLPAGDYALQLLPMHGALPRRFVRVESGEESEVRIDGSRLETFVLTLGDRSEATDVLVRERETRRTLLAARVDAGEAVELLLEPGSYLVDVGGETRELTFPSGGGEVSFGERAAAD